MTVGAAIAPLTARPENGPRSAELAIGRRAFKQVWKGAVGWGLVFGAIAASSAQTYVTTFPTEASRAQLASLTGADPGLAVLLGPSSSIGTVGGYTVYKVFVTLTTIGAIWGLLVATRLLRGEEDTGRWQLVLAGSTRPDRATGATLAGLGAAVALVFLGTTLAIIAVGRSPDVGFGATESVLFGLSTIIAPAVFVAVGAMTSQLGRTRRVATGLGSAVLALAFVLRMIADTGPGTKWLLWLTPFGWVELMQPFTENNSLPLVPTTVCIIVLGYAAMVLAARRDAGDGILASTDVAAPRPFGLRSSLGLAGRLELPVLVGWCVGMAFAGIVCGIIIKMTTAAIPDSMRDLLDKFGVLAR